MGLGGFPFVASLYLRRGLGFEVLGVEGLDGFRGSGCRESGVQGFGGGGGGG